MDNEVNTDQQQKIKILQAELEKMQSRLYAIKIAYMNRSEWEERVPEYEDVAAVAKELIKLNYDLQKLLYGKVRMKLSVAKLLRSSR
jgi:hypothetical protein